MLQVKPGAHFSLKGMQGFAGIWPAKAALGRYLRFEGHPVGVAVSRQERQFAVSCNVAGRREIREFSLDDKPAHRLATWLMDRIPGGVTGHVCVEHQFVEHLKSSDEAFALQDVVRTSMFRFWPIHGEMLAAYQQVLGLRNADDVRSRATFLARVASSSLSYLFLTSLGRPPSCQDILRFLNDGEAFSTVMGVLPHRNDMCEMFILARSRRTPRAVDPVQLGLAYYSTQRRFANLPAAWSYRLALLSACRKHAIRLGYGAWLFPKEAEG